MSTAEQILVLILASALAVLLVLAIIAIISVIRLVQTLRRVARTAERVIETAESAAEMFKKTATPVGVFSFVKQVVGMVSHPKSKKEK